MSNTYTVYLAIGRVINNANEKLDLLDNYVLQLLMFIKIVTCLLFHFFSSPLAVISL